MGTENRRRKSDRPVLLFVIGALFVSVVVGISASVVSFIQVPRVSRNTTALRASGYETCVRGNGVRAELQFRAQLAPPKAIAGLVKQLGLPAHIAEQTGVKALRKRLPIYDCAPLLHDHPAVRLSNRAQQRYVNNFASGKLALPAPH